MTVAVVRLLGPADSGAYVELLDRLDRDSTMLMWEPGERAISASEIAEAMSLDDRAWRLRLVAVVDNDLVGFLVAHRGALRRSSHRCDITMAVLSDFHGRGVGSQLLDSLERWARATGLERIELTVMAHNHRAIRLYERAGFVTEGIKRAAIVVDGVAVDEVMMGKARDRPRS